MGFDYLHDALHKRSNAVLYLCVLLSPRRDANIEFLPYDIYRKPIIVLFDIRVVCDCVTPALIDLQLRLLRY